MYLLWITWCSRHKILNTIIQRHYREIIVFYLYFHWGFRLQTVSPHDRKDMNRKVIQFWGEKVQSMNLLNKNVLRKAMIISLFVTTVLWTPRFKLQFRLLDGNSTLVLTRSQNVGLGSTGNSKCLTRGRGLTGSLELTTLLDIKDALCHHIIPILKILKRMVK